MITIFVAQCALLGLMGWYVLRGGRSKDTSALRDAANAPLTAADAERVRNLLATAGSALSDHSTKLEAFERVLDEANRNGQAAEGFGRQVGDFRRENERVEQAVETTLEQLVESCGDLLRDQQTKLESYQQKTHDIGATLDDHDDVLIRIAGTLLNMVADLRTENKAVRREVAAGQEKITGLVGRARSAEHLARIDALTQLPNRRAFDEKLAACDETLHNHGQPYCLVMIDIDHFKAVNDQFGHATGDAVLSLIGRILRETCKAGDHASRLGGEEFAVLLTKCELEPAKFIAERLRQKVKAAVLRSNNQPVSVTVSCGIAQAKRGETTGGLLDRADAALYAAKQMGRNQTCADGAATETAEHVAAT